MPWKPRKPCAPPISREPAAGWTYTKWQEIAAKGWKARHDAVFLAVYLVFEAYEPELRALGRRLSTAEIAACLMPEATGVERKGLATTLADLARSGRCAKYARKDGPPTKRFGGHAATWTWGPPGDKEAWENNS